MRAWPLATCSAAGGLLVHADLALAGMPNLTLSDAARLRVETISFFLLGLLLCGWAIQKLWNYLRRDFVSLPQLSYPRALGITVLWGLLFILVLTMIAAACGRRWCWPAASASAWPSEFIRPSVTPTPSTSPPPSPGRP